MPTTVGDFTLSPSLSFPEESNRTATEYYYKRYMHVLPSYSRFLRFLIPVGVATLASEFLTEPLNKMIISRNIPNFPRGSTCRSILLSSLSAAMPNDERVREWREKYGVGEGGGGGRESLFGEVVEEDNDDPYA